MTFASIPELLAELRAGIPIIVVDDELRENEGDIVLPAEVATPAWVNFMAKEARGLICVSLSPERTHALGIKPMCLHNTDNHGTAFAMSVDHVSTKTGISAYERATTIQALAKGGAAADFRQPGHVFPLIAKRGGVLERPGHTEASVDLVRLAGFSPAAVICEIMGDDGHMARLPELTTFAQKHNLKLGCIADLQAYLQARDTQLMRVAETKLPTEYGTFTLIGFEDCDTGREHVALVMGDITEGRAVLTRVHSECLTGDVLHSKRCDCGGQREAALRAIATEGRGVFIYLRQEGRGIGLLNKIKAYALQDKGLDTVEANLALGFPADARNFAIAAHMLHLLAVKSVRLMSNNPEKVTTLMNMGIQIDKRVALEVGQNPHNLKYLETKRHRMGHFLESVAEPESVMRRVKAA